MAIAEHRNPSVEEFRRRDSRLLPIHLSKQDSDSLVLALTGVREELEAIDQARVKVNKGSTTLDSLLLALKDQEDSVLAGARERLRSSFTTDGATRFDTYIRESVKRCIVIYGY
jgi:hypothetical protein